MIFGIGVDIVTVDRFGEWETYSRERLLKVFSASELADFEKNGGNSAQFFASRFAAKEAFYKALSATLVSKKLTAQSFSFQFVRQYIEVIKGEWGIPVLKINWKGFEGKVGEKLAGLNVQLSLSHEKSVTIAFVTIS